MAMILFIAGAGGFGREVLDAVLASAATGGASAPEIVFLDDALHGRVIRTCEVRRLEEAQDGQVVIAIAEMAAREQVARRLSPSLEPLTIRHPLAAIAPECQVDDGSVLLAHVYVSSSVRIGMHSHLNYNATIGHDCRLGRYVTVLPGANISGNVTLEDGVTVGANACVLQGLTVGARAVIGAGAVVVRDVPPGTIVKGVPARP